MPHLFSSGNADDETVAMADNEHDKENVLTRTWKQMGNWLKSEDENGASPAPEKAEDSTEVLSEKLPLQGTATVPIRPSRNVIPSMPRPITFKRQDSERRERLYPHEPGHDERRATSSDRRPGTSSERKISPLRLPELANSIPKPLTLDATSRADIANHDHHDFASTAGTLDGHDGDKYGRHLETLSHYQWFNHLDALHHPDQLSDALSDLQIQNELEAKWILNLSMHFRDHSDREKFFITYAEEPNHWRRVTVSCDYRFAPDDSLEADLSSLHYQRDKSARIYEAIRDSLPGIQFYPTVTNLKLETDEGRLHVHVTEDVNEIIEYPPLASIAHLDLATYEEEGVEFEGHLSGFVYKVKAAHGPEVFIKKEIPGPQAIDEFLYEINALSALRDAENVIDIRGIVIDTRQRIKGILLSYATSGALVDLLYDSIYHPSPFTSIPLHRRLKWAQQACAGLSNIHESGFVQGDLTLSNIVIDSHDNAHIIDINRRGCPIGWEPPEFRSVIENGRKVSMYIGVKSDLWQLGMILFGLGEGIDEPERVEKPLRWSENVKEELPSWYKLIVELCLSEEPRRRLSARELCMRFPPAAVDEPVHRAVLPSLGESVATTGGDNRFNANSVHLYHEIRRPSPLGNAGPGDIDADVEYIAPPTTSLPGHSPLLVAKPSRLAGSVGPAGPAVECDAHATVAQGDFIHTLNSNLLPTTTHSEVRTVPKSSLECSSFDESMAEGRASSAAEAAPDAPLNVSNTNTLSELSNPQAIPIVSPLVAPQEIAPSEGHPSMSGWQKTTDPALDTSFPWLADQSDQLAIMPQDLGFPVMATLSPLNELSAVTTPLSHPPSVGLNEVFAILSIAPEPPSTVSPADSVNAKLIPVTEELGFPRLATFPPPAALAASPTPTTKPLSDGVPSAASAAEAHGDASIPTTNHVPVHLRTNTLGIEMLPEHHDSSFDEMSSAASGKNDTSASLLVEALHAPNAPCQGTNEQPDVTAEISNGATESPKDTNTKLL